MQVARVLFSAAQVGLKITIAKVMTKQDTGNQKYKLQRIIELLRFVITLDDPEIVKSTIESVIELLEEEINK